LVDPAAPDATPRLEFRDALTGAVHAAEGEHLDVELAPWQGAVLVQQC